MHPAERAMSRISAMSYGSGAHGRESSLSAHEGREFADKHGKHHYFKYWSDVHGPHQVSFDATVLQIRNIDTANETFEAKLAIEQQWMMTEGDVVSSLEDKHETVPDFSPEWHPSELEFPNALDFDTKHTQYHVAHIGTMRCWARTTTVNGTFSQALDLKNFPWDTQTLSIKIQWSDDQTELHVFPSDSRPLLTLAADMGRTLTAWEVVLSSLEFGVHVRKTLGTTFKVHREKFPTALLSIQVSRMSKPFVFQVFVVLGMISLCSLTALMPDAESEIGTRLSTATTLFLTVIAFQFVVSALLPKLPYLTITDYYVLFCLIFVSSILGEVGFITWFDSHWDKRIGVEMDTWILAGNTAVFVGFNFFYALYVMIFAIPAERKKLRPQYGRHEKSRHDYQLTSGHVVETEDRRFVYTGEPYPLGRVNDAPRPAMRNRIADSSKHIVEPGFFECHIGRRHHYFTLFHVSDPPPEGQEVTDVHKAMGMRKITGDRHVPAGVLVVTAAHPPSFPGGPEEGRFKIRTSVTKAETDVTAYTWLRVTLTCTSRDEIRMEEALPGAPTVVKFPITFKRVNLNLMDDPDPEELADAAQRGAKGRWGRKRKDGKKNDAAAWAAQAVKPFKSAIDRLAGGEEEEAAERDQEAKEQEEAEHEAEEADREEEEELNLELFEEAKKEQLESVLAGEKAAALLGQQGGGFGAAATAGQKQGAGNGNGGAYFPSIQEFFDDSTGGAGGVVAGVAQQKKGRQQPAPAGGEAPPFGSRFPAGNGNGAAGGGGGGGGGTRAAAALNAGGSGVGDVAVEDFRELTPSGAPTGRVVSRTKFTPGGATKKPPGGRGA